MSNPGHYICAYGSASSCNVSASLPGHIAAKFPKFVRVKETKLYTMSNEEVPITKFDATLRPVDGNPANETGMKRLRKFLEVCEREGITPPDTGRGMNTVPLSEVLKSTAIQSPVHPPTEVPVLADRAAVTARLKYGKNNS